MEILMSTYLLIAIVVWVLFEGGLWLYAAHRWSTPDETRVPNWVSVATVLGLIAFGLTIGVAICSSA